MKAIEYSKGQVMGNDGVVFIEDKGYRHFNSKKIRYALFKCKCGKLFETAILKVKNGHTKSCGCRKIEVSREINKIHGLSNHRLFFLWASIKRRIFNKNTISYANYGGRGIGMYDKWVHDAEMFINYCMTLDGWDNTKSIIDRIDNEGDYEPGNIRFVNNRISALNRRKHKSNTSGHEGVAFDKTHNQWQAYAYEYHKKITIYRGQSKDIAIQKRNEYLINNDILKYKPLNNR